jgi:hypothetical protein
MKQSDTTTAKKEPKKIRLRDLIPVDYTDGSWPEDEQGELAYDYWKRASGVLDEEEIEEAIDWFKLVYGETKLGIAKRIKATPSKTLETLAKPNPDAGGAQKFQRDFAIKELEYRKKIGDHENGNPKYKADYASYGNLGIKEDLEEKASWIDGYIDKYTQMVYKPKEEILTLTWRNYEKFPKDVKLDKASWETLSKSQNRPRAFNQLWMSGKIKAMKEETSLDEAYDKELSKYELNGELNRVNGRIKFLQSAHSGSALPADAASELKKLQDLRDSILAMLKEEDILDDVDADTITEALNMLQRMKRRSIMRRNKSKILAGRRRAQRRRASTSVLQQRAVRAARAALARRLLRKSKGEASYGEKVRVEKMLASRQGAIKNIARRLLSKVRQKERMRFQKRATPPKPIQPIKPNK